MSREEIVKLIYSLDMEECLIVEEAIKQLQSEDADN